MNLNTYACQEKRSEFRENRFLFEHNFLSQLFEDEPLRTSREDTMMEGSLRVFWTVAATWWKQPLFDIPRRQLLNEFAPPGTPAAITTITKAARGAWWLKGALVPVGAAVRQLARNLLRNRASAAAAHVLASQLPNAAPAAAAHVLVNELPHAAPMPWRVAWFIITSVLTLIGPPAVKALRKVHMSRQKRQTNVETTRQLGSKVAVRIPSQATRFTPTNISPQQDALQAYLPSMMLALEACLLILVLGYVVWRARGWMKASPEAAEKVAFEEEAVVKKAKPTASIAAAEQTAGAAEMATFEKRLVKPTATKAAAEQTAAAAEMAVLHEHEAAEKKALEEKAAAEKAEAASLRRELEAVRAATELAAAEAKAAIGKAAVEAKAAAEKAAAEAKAAARQAADDEAAAEKAAAGMAASEARADENSVDSPATEKAARTRSSVEPMVSLTRLMNVDEDEEIVFDLWDDPLPASHRPRKTASFAKRSAAEKAAAEEALVASMKAAAASKKAKEKSETESATSRPPPPPRQKATDSPAAKGPIEASPKQSALQWLRGQQTETDVDDVPASTSSPDIGKEIGKAVSFVFVESPKALLESSAELIDGLTIPEAD